MIIAAIFILETIHLMKLMIVLIKIQAIWLFDRIYRIKFVSCAMNITLHYKHNNKN